jgi:hypothetical protein
MSSKSTGSKPESGNCERGGSGFGKGNFAQSGMNTAVTEIFGLLMSLLGVLVID